MSISDCLFIYLFVNVYFNIKYHSFPLLNIKQVVMPILQTLVQR